MKLNESHYRKIRYFEKKYGSLVNTPDALLRPLWIELEDDETRAMNNRAMDLIVDGYSLEEAAKRTGIGKDALRNLAYRRGVTLRQRFRYIIHDSDGNEYYVTALTSAYKYLLKREHEQPNTDRIRKTLKQLGYSIEPLTKNMYWKDVPDFSFYVTKQGLYYKHGVESYERSFYV